MTKSEVNIIGFVKSVSEDEQVIVDGESVIKKPFIMFHEEAQINVIFWNRLEDLNKNDLVTIQDDIIKMCHRGKCINVSTSLNLIINPQYKEAERLNKRKISQNNPNTSQKVDLSYGSQATLIKSTTGM